MTRRAPQPTDTALARLVARLVARWPLVLRSTHESEVRARQAEITRLRTEMHMLHQTVADLRVGYESLMRDLRLPVAPVNVTVRRDECLMATRVRADFQPVFYLVDERDRIQNRYPAAAEAMMEAIAAQMAHHHAREVRDVILARLKQLREGMSR